MEYFILHGHDSHGPFTESELREGLDAGELLATDLARSDEMLHWTPLVKLLDEPPSVRPPDMGALPTPFSSNPIIVQPSPAPSYLQPAPAPRNFWSWIPEDPVRAGLIGIVAASAIAFLARWPVLLALPGVLIGAAAGVILILRGRAIPGVILSLVSILLPLALLPRPGAPTSEPESAVAAPQPAPAPVPFPKPSTGPIALPERTLPPPADTMPGGNR